MDGKLQIILTFGFGLMVMGMAIGVIAEKAACDYDHAVRAQSFMDYMPRSDYLPESICTSSNTFGQKSLIEDIAVCYEI